MNSLKYGQFCLNVSDIPQDAAKALPEVIVEDLKDGLLHQMFPVHPNYSSGFAGSAWRLPPPPDPCHHQVVISWHHLLSSSPQIWQQSQISTFGLRWAWDQVHLWATLWSNTVFDTASPWLAQKSNNKAPPRFRWGELLLLITDAPVELWAGLPESFILQRKLWKCSRVTSKGTDSSCAVAVAVINAS